MNRLHENNIIDAVAEYAAHGRRSVRLSVRVSVPSIDSSNDGRQAGCMLSALRQEIFDHNLRKL